MIVTPFKKISVLLRNKKQFIEAVKSTFVSRIYFELNDEFINDINYFIDQCKMSGVELFLALPHVQKDDCIDYIINFNVTGFLIRTYGQFRNFSKCGKKLIIDRTLNCFNRSSINCWIEKGAYLVTLSSELDRTEINNCATNNCEIVCYGYIHNMITLYCPVRLYSSCDGFKENDNYFLNDRKGNKFYVLPNCKFCYCLILNSNAIFLLNCSKDMKKTIPEFIRLEFTIEQPSLINTIINAYGNIFCEKSKINDISISQAIDHFNQAGFTKGHFLNGVE